MTRIIRYGDFGADVSDIQQRLIECGIALNPAELEYFTVGTSTLTAIKEFQRTQGLMDDGVVGPLTLNTLLHPKATNGKFTATGWRLDKNQWPDILVRVLQTAIDDLGLREDPDGSNNGPQLAKFRTGGNPWCALTIYTWYLNYENGTPWPRTASTWALYQWAKKNRLLLPKTAAWRPGDIWYVKRPPPPGDSTPRGHVTLIVTDLGAARASCIGGNEGNCVRGSVRSRENATDIIRPTGLI